MALTTTTRRMGMEDPSNLSPRLRQDFFRRMSEKRSSTRWTGWLAVVAGALAILFPLIGTLTVNAFAGVALIVSGGVMAYMAFSHSGWALVGQVLAGLLSIAGGIVMLAFPVVGIFWLTIMLAAVFAAEGGMQIWSALKLRPDGSWGWMLASGIASVALALLVLVFTPATLPWLLGLFVGVNLLSTGIALVMLASRLSPEHLAKMFPDPRAEGVVRDPATAETMDADGRPVGTAGAPPVPPQATA